MYHLMKKEMSPVVTEDYMINEDGLTIWLRSCGERSA